jgi:tetratricopeptide (TPR) repeat protein
MPRDWPKDSFCISPPAPCRWDEVWRLTGLVIKPFSAGIGPTGEERPIAKRRSCLPARLKACSHLVVVTVLLVPMASSCSRGSKPGEETATDSLERGLSALEKSNYDLAITCFSEVIRLDPEDSMAYNNRGFAHGQKGEYDKAIADYTEAIRLNPTYALAYYNRGDAYGDKGERDRAVRDYTTAIRLNPNMADAFNNRGGVYLLQAAHDRAVEDFGEAIRLNPKHAMAFLNRGAAYAEKGQYELAIDDYTEAIRLDPQSAGAFNSLAWLLATCPDAQYRDGPTAVENATQACQLTGWLNPISLSTLAAAYAEKGESEEAVKWQTKVVEMATADGDKTAFESRLELYKTGKPYRDKR